MDGTQPLLTPPGSDDLAEILGPGVLSLEPGGALRFADGRAMELLGCSDGFELERLWPELKPRLEGAGLSWDGVGGVLRRTVLDLAVQGEPERPESSRRLAFDLRRDPEGGGVLLVQDFATLAGLETDLRLTSQMRSVTQITPAVAHDLRAPINAMVFNIEILKETIASGRATDPNDREQASCATSPCSRRSSPACTGGSRPSWPTSRRAATSPRRWTCASWPDELADSPGGPGPQAAGAGQGRAAGRAGAGGGQPVPPAAGPAPPLPRRPGRRSAGRAPSTSTSSPLDGRARLRVHGAAGPDSPADAPPTRLRLPGSTCASPRKGRWRSSGWPGRSWPPRAARCGRRIP